MKKPAMSLLLLALASVSSAAMADSWKHGHGEGRHGREYRQVYWDGPCKVEQKWKKGSYKEKRKCARPDRYHAQRYHDDRYDERPVVRRYYPAYPNDYAYVERRDPQVNIDIRIRQ